MRIFVIFVFFVCAFNSAYAWRVDGDNVEFSYVGVYRKCAIDEIDGRKFVVGVSGECASEDVSDFSSECEQDGGHGYDCIANKCGEILYQSFFKENLENKTEDFYKKFKSVIFVDCSYFGNDFLDYIEKNAVPLEFFLLGAEELNEMKNQHFMRAKPLPLAYFYAAYVQSVNGNPRYLSEWLEDLPESELLGGSSLANKHIRWLLNHAKSQNFSM